MRCSVWAPKASRVELVYADSGKRVPLAPRERGYFAGEASRLQHGVRYGFSLDGGPVLPDPRSRFQPEGVHGPSEWFDFGAFQWTDHGFRPEALTSAVVYELHVGTFSEEGTFDGVLQHLDHLVNLGVTHVELMPVAAFPGRRGWGYDGVDWYAPHAAYGGPAGLMRLVDGCHARGLSVILDVVYNHLGPSGNYLGQFGPYFSQRYGTPWGEAVNFDGPGSDEVRRFVCDNALHWLRHYHIDGLRLDAVHAIFDQSALHVLEQMASEVAALSTELRKPLVLIAESNLNDPRFVRPATQGGFGLSSQWSDDFHHALRTLLTGDRSGYYEDFGSMNDLAEALRHGFVYRGRYSRHRGHSYGREPAGLRGRHFHAFCQNHDQVGNRALGDRLGHSVTLGQLQIAAALTLLSPFVPMLFMGEEWGASSPFRYFTDHSEPELAEAVRRGRRQEFQAFGWNPDQIPDPQADDTFEASKLKWAEVSSEPHRMLLDWYQKLIRLRRGEPSLLDDTLDKTRVELDERAGWLRLQRGELCICVNFSDAERRLERSSLAPHETSLQLLLASHRELALSDRALVLPPHSVCVTAQGR